MAIVISNKAAYVFAGAFLIVLIAAFVFAYGGSTPSVMGHSAGEVMITLPNGTSTTLQSAVTNNFIGGGGVFSSIVTVECSTATMCDNIKQHACCSVECPAGYKVVGGGCAAFHTWWQVRVSQPLSVQQPGKEGWTCSIGEDYGLEVYNQAGKGYAICAK